MTEVNILLIEDNKNDAQLVAEALKDASLPHRLDLVSDGEEALRHLREREMRPDLVLLDLNLPKLSGIEVLKAIKADPYLKVIPVIILTNSTAPDDVAECYENFANAYIRKPIGFDGLTATIITTGQFWFRTAVLPGNHTVLQRATTPPFGTPPKSLPPASKRRPSAFKRPKK